MAHGTLPTPGGDLQIGGWTELYPPKTYAEVLSPSTSDCDRIQNQGQCICDELRGHHTGGGGARAITGALYKRGRHIHIHTGPLCEDTDTQVGRPRDDRGRDGTDVL